MHYKVTSEVVQHCELGAYRSYGIACCGCAIGDISTDLPAVEKLAQCLNGGQVQLCHFFCVVEDFLCG